MAKNTDLFVVQREVVKEGYPNIDLIIVPSGISTDFESLVKKLEDSQLNKENFLPHWGKILLLYHVVGVEKVKFYTEDVQPILFSDWANRALLQLSEHLEEEDPQYSQELEELLIYFVGELTLLKDGTL